MKTTFCCDKGTIFRRYIVMLKRMMIMQALIAVLAQFILGANALGGLITMADAEQQVGAKIGWMPTSGGQEIIISETYVPVTPQGLGDADLNIWLEDIGVSSSASLVSAFVEDQFSANGSTTASATWGDQPIGAYDVHGVGDSRFSAIFFTNPSPAYFHIDGHIDVGMSGLNWYPEYTYVFVKLFRAVGSDLELIWEAGLDGADAETSIPLDYGLWLEGDHLYAVRARAISNTLAVEVSGSAPVLREASFSFTATIDDNSGEMPLLPDLEGEFGQVKLKEPVNVGDKIKTQIIVTNNGFIALARKQVIDIEICLRPCGVIGDAEDIFVMTLDELSVSNLQAGKSRKFNAHIIVPVDIEGGEYRLAAKVDSSNDVIEFIEINNTAISDCFEILGSWQ
jgi:hypothetical protein